MWIYLTLVSAVMLGVYDVAKKAAVGRNSVMWVLSVTSAMSALMLAPYYEGGSLHDFALIIPKAFLVTISWISGLEGMKRLPLTISSTIKASRPVFVVIASIIIFGERLNTGQSIGVLVSLSALAMLSLSSRREGIYFSRNKGIWWMWLAVVSGVASALYDKHIMRGLSPAFVQSWSTLFITILMFAVLFWQQHRSSERTTFTWDWNLLVVSVSILLADMAYFHALKDPDALLSIVSLMRRGCAIISFILSVLIFKEKNITRKALSLSVLMAGMVIMAVSS